jgi:hypothetical protein
MGVYSKNNTANNLIVDSNSINYSQLNSVNNISETKYNIDPRSLWADYGPGDSFDEVYAADAGSGILIMGNHHHDNYTGQVWLTNYSGDHWKKIDPVLFPDDSPEYGSSVAIGPTGIAIGAANNSISTNLSRGLIEIYDYDGEYSSIKYIDPKSTIEPTVGNNGANYGDMGTLALGSRRLAVGGGEIRTFTTGDPIGGLAVLFWDYPVSSLSNSDDVITLEDFAGKHSLNYTTANDSAFGYSVAYGQNRFFVSDYFLDGQGEPRSGGIQAWTQEGTFMRSYYFPNGYYGGSGTGIASYEGQGYRIKVGSGYVGTGLDARGGGQWHQDSNGAGIRCGGIWLWEIESGTPKFEDPLIHPRAQSYGGAFGTYGFLGESQGDNGRDGDFDIGCGYIVGASSAAHSTNNTGSIVVWTLDGTLVEDFNIDTVTNREHHIRSVNIADGYVFVTGNLKATSTDNGFCYRYKLPESLDTEVESLLSPYINLAEE